MAKGMDQQKAAVESGHWPLYPLRPAPRRRGQEPVPARFPAAEVPLEEYIYNETRYAQLRKFNPEAAQELLRSAQEAVETRWRRYEHLARMEVTSAD